MSATGGQTPGPEPDGGNDRRWLTWIPLGLAGILALVFVMMMDGDGERPAGGSGGQTSSAVPSTQAVPPPQVVVREIGHPLIRVGGGWDLFARVSGEVLRIELARGRITSTEVPGLASGGPVSFLAMPGRAIVRPIDRVPGFAVPDGAPATRLEGALSSGGAVFPGPEPGQVWHETTHDSLELVGPDGQRTGAVIELPAQSFRPVSGDGRGNVVLAGPDGAYLADEAGLRRISGGILLAAGRTHFVFLECDAGGGCSRVSVQRSTGSRLVLGPGTGEGRTPRGVVAPEGGVAAIPVAEGGEVTLHLFDLTTGDDRELPVQGTGYHPFARAKLAFSPDGDWLFAVSGGEIVAVNIAINTTPNAATMVRVGIGLGDVPPIRQIATRQAS